MIVILRRDFMDRGIGERKFSAIRRIEDRVWEELNQPLVITGAPSFHAWCPDSAYCAGLVPVSRELVQQYSVYGH